MSKTKAIAPPADDIKVNVKGFKIICQAQKNDLFRWICDQMTEYYGELNVVNGGDYIFCSGNVPMCLCAHLDTVHSEQPRTFLYDKEKGTITDPNGIGGDDRCGVYSILAILNALGDAKKPSLFFSTDEESGGASTKQAAIDLKDHSKGINFLIELDRRGNIDSVYYECGNEEFKKWIDGFGFVEQHGSFTDICTLCSSWDLAGVNLSVGYYDEHKKNEKVVLNEMGVTITKVVKIINAMDGTLYPYCKKKDFYSACYYRELKVGDRVKVLFDTNGYSEPVYYSGIIGLIPKGTMVKIDDQSVGPERYVLVTYRGVTMWVSAYSF